MKLNTLKTSGKHPMWCGPSALSIITGRTVNYCAQLIADQRNSWGWYKGKGTGKQVKGVANNEMLRAFRKMGYDMKRVKIPRHHHRHQVMSINPAPFVMPTLHRYMRERGGEQWKGVMLINVTDHYVVAHRDMICDNRTPAHYTKHRCRRQKIQKAWLITRIPRRKLAKR